jgi:hypothetical protein
VIRIAKLGRYFALFEDTDMLALVVYRKGAERLKARLEELITALRERDRYIANHQSRNGGG